MNRRFLSISEVANYLGLAPKTITNWLCAGKFPVPFVKIGRLTKFDVQDIETYVASLNRYCGNEVKKERKEK